MQQQCPVTPLQVFHALEEGQRHGRSGRRKIYSLPSSFKKDIPPIQEYPSCGEISTVLSVSELYQYILEDFENVHLTRHSDKDECH